MTTGALPLINWPRGVPQTMGALLRWQAARRGHRELLRFGSARMTVADVEARTTQLATFLRAAGVGPGDRVAVMLPNGLEFPVCWLAIATLGAIMVPLNVQYRAHDLAYTLDDSGAGVLLVDPALEDEARTAMERCPALRQLHLLPPGTMTSPTAGPVAAALHAYPTTAEPCRVRPTDLLNLQYTSGTTGAPKGCMLSHAYWARLAVQSARFAQLGDDDVVLTAQPFYYMDPQWNVAMCLLVGCPLVILPRFSASGFWTSVHDAGATFVYLLGTMPLLLLKQPPRPAVERGHRLRFVACSGIVPQLHAAFESRWGVPWREAFGMTETGLDLAVLLHETDCVGSGAVGRAGPRPGGARRGAGRSGVRRRRGR
jgi:acyl-CoA synthetase (AMP-forming)/AMP-acid ligase II